MITIAEEVKSKRSRLGLSQRELALLLDMKENGERTIRGWETGDHKPSKAKFQQLLSLHEDYPLKDSRSHHDFSFIDLFAGIGGIRLPYQNLGGKCVFSSEWDKFAQKTYSANYGEIPHGDITKISVDEIPDHDILLGGFPCQAFSQAGKKQGFNDTRGTMFFEIQRILATKRPKAFMLENVKQLKGHDKGKTLETIIAILIALVYGLIIGFLTGVVSSHLSILYVFLNVFITVLVISCLSVTYSYIKNEINEKSLKYKYIE